MLYNMIACIKFYHGGGKGSAHWELRLSALRVKAQHAGDKGSIIQQKEPVSSQKQALDFHPYIIFSTPLSIHQTYFHLLYLYNLTY